MQVGSKKVDCLLGIIMRVFKMGKIGPVFIIQARYVNMSRGWVLEI